MRPWRISFDGHVWTSDQIPAAHAIAVAALLPSTLGYEIAPHDGPQQLCAWLAVLLASSRVTPASISEIEALVGSAMREISQLPLDTFLGCLTDPWPAPSGEAEDPDPDKIDE